MWVCKLVPSCLRVAMDFAETTAQILMGFRNKPRDSKTQVAVSVGLRWLSRLCEFIPIRSIRKEAETTNGTSNKDVNRSLDDGGEEPQATSRYDLWSACVFMSDSLAGFNAIEEIPFFNSAENISKSLMQHLSADSLEARSKILHHIKKTTPTYPVEKI
uniref:Uncharacterized protein n=1 Tax=Glossina pallidipes TaxID=7398 RepID=A0A1B0A5R3_GLOPL